MSIADNSDYSFQLKIIKKNAKLIFIFPLFLRLFSFFLYVKLLPHWEVEGTFSFGNSFLSIHKSSQKEVVYFLNNPTQNSSFENLVDSSLTAKIIPDTNYIKFKLKAFSEDAILDNIKLLDTSLKNYFLVELKRLKKKSDHQKEVLSSLSSQLSIKLKKTEPYNPIMSLLIENFLAEAQLRIEDLKIEDYLILSSAMQSSNTEFNFSFAKPKNYIFTLHNLFFLLFMYLAFVLVLVYSLLILKINK
jgi:hypothetical protein